MLDNPNNARSVLLNAKVPLPVKEYFMQIAKREKRTKSTLLYLLLLRGMKAYRQDGQLPTLTEAIEFVNSLEPARRRKHG